MMSVALGAMPGFSDDAKSASPHQNVAGAQPNADGWTGSVIETMDAGSYTYVRVDTGKEKIWAAAPQFQVKVGDKVSVPQGIPMENFESKTLKRTFDVVYFVGAIQTAGSAHSAQAPLDPHAGFRNPVTSLPPANMDFSGIKKAQGGFTVADVFSRKAELSKQQVSVRGKVVKSNLQVMNKNWLHVQDGTGAAGANDLTVTTADTAKVGDTVLVTGTLGLMRDFGYGYKYEVLLENSKVTVEAAAKP
jgi:ribosomal protein S17